MAKLREFNGITLVDFGGEFYAQFSEAFYEIVEKDLIITGILSEIFGEDIVDKDGKKIPLPTEPVQVKVPMETYTKEGTRKDGSTWKMEFKHTEGIKWGIKLLTEAIEPGQPFKGQVCFKLPQTVINAIETGKNARGQVLTPEEVDKRIAEEFFVEKLEAVTFKAPEAGKKGGWGGAPKQAELGRLNDRFQFLVEKLPGGEPATNLYELYWNLVAQEMEDKPTFTELLNLILG